MFAMAVRGAVLDASQAPLLEGRPVPHAQTNQLPNVRSCSPLLFIITRVFLVYDYIYMYKGYVNVKQTSILTIKLEKN